MASGQITLAQLKAAAKAKVRTSAEAQKPKVVRAQKPCKYRQSLTPGRVAVMLHGRYAGRRVVVVKTLAAGLVAVCGPRAVNGVPLRRVHQKMLLAVTAPEIDMSAVDASKVDMALFRQGKKARRARNITEQTEEDKKSAPSLSEEQKAVYDAVDAALTTAVEKAHPHMKTYLRHKFTLDQTLGLPLHQLKF